MHRNKLKSLTGTEIEEYINKHFESQYGGLIPQVQKVGNPSDINHYRDILDTWLTQYPNSFLAMKHIDGTWDLYDIYWLDDHEDALKDIQEFTLVILKTE